MSRSPDLGLVLQGRSIAFGASGSTGGERGSSARSRRNRQFDRGPTLPSSVTSAQLQPLLDAKAYLACLGQAAVLHKRWWMIIKDTKHLAQAQAFVRWLSRAPGWQPSAPNASISRESVATVQKISIRALHAKVSRDQAALEALLDTDALRVLASPWPHVVPVDPRSSAIRARSRAISGAKNRSALTVTTRSASSSRSTASSYRPARPSISASNAR